MNSNTDNKKWQKIAWFIAGVILIAAPFVLLLCDVLFPKWLMSLLLLGGLVALARPFLKGAPHREARRYVKENGEFDMDTPRSYEAMPTTWMQNFIGLQTLPLKRNMIRRFDYADGRVRIEMANDKVLDAPLSEIEMIVRKNPKGEGPTAYELRHGDIKIFPLQNDVAFEDLEVEDMWNILFRCSSVREPKSLKALSFGYKILSVADDATSDSSIGDSFMEGGVGQLSGTSEVEIIGTEAQGKPKKKLTVKRVLLWIGGVVLLSVIPSLVLEMINNDDTDTSSYDTDNVETMVEAVEPELADGEAYVVDEAYDVDEVVEEAAEIPEFDYRWFGGPFTYNGVIYRQSGSFGVYDTVDSDGERWFNFCYKMVPDDGSAPVVVMRDKYEYDILTYVGKDKSGRLKFEGKEIEDPYEEVAYKHVIWLNTDNGIPVSINYAIFPKGSSSPSFDTLYNLKPIDHDEFVSRYVDENGEVVG